ncbi:MAG: putative manganese-dependent inorganic diphosphatase [Bacillota bacterium]
MKKEKVFIIGHKNPDTDSICAAISYANLKNQIDSKEYLPRRAGEVSAETQFVLDYFGIEEPELLTDVGAQVSDLSITHVTPLTKDMSMKNAWNTMRDEGKATLPVVEKNKLKGIIAVKDIATANMDIYEDRILALAKTTYKNILETIDGTMAIGSEDGCVTTGKLLVGTAQVDLLEKFIDEGDILITGNRFESQFCGVEMKAGAIIVCMGAPVSQTIQKFAKENGVRIITTPHDTYMTSRLVSQSVPISYMMRTTDLVTFETSDYVREIHQTLSLIRHRDFPVLDDNGKYLGMFSRRNLLHFSKKKIIMVDHNEKNQAIENIEDAEILEIIDHHRLGNLETSTPVYFRNQPVGCTCTIVYTMYNENNIDISKEIAGLLCSAIISDTLMFRSPTCTAVDKLAAEALAKIAEIDIQSHAEAMFRAGSNLVGKSIKELFYQDYKEFFNEKLNFGVGQISALYDDELVDIGQKLSEFMQEELSPDKHNFFLLTNIFTQTSTVIFSGQSSSEIMTTAFEGEVIENSMKLVGVVSRKKQFIPKLLHAIQEMELT